MIAIKIFLLLCLIAYINCYNDSLIVVIDDDELKNIEIVVIDDEFKNNNSLIVVMDDDEFTNNLKHTQVLSGIINL